MNPHDSDATADRVADFRRNLCNVLAVDWPADAADVAAADADRLAALQQRCGTVSAAAYLIIRKKRDW